MSGLLTHTPLRRPSHSIQDKHAHKLLQVNTEGRDGPQARAMCSLSSWYLLMPHDCEVSPLPIICPLSASFPLHTGVSPNAELSLDSKMSAYRWRTTSPVSVLREFTFREERLEKLRETACLACLLSPQVRVYKRHTQCLKHTMDLHDPEL